MSRLNNVVARTQEERNEGDIEDVEEDANSESDVEFNLDGDLEKDDTEEELEQLVFGDSVGFRERLKSFRDEDEAEDQDATGLEGLDDADVGQALRDDFPETSGLIVCSCSSPTLHQRVICLTHLLRVRTIMTRLYDPSCQLLGKTVTMSE